MSATGGWKLSFEMATSDDIAQIVALSKELIDRYEDVTSIDYDKVLHWIQRKIEDNIFQYVRTCDGKETVGFYRLDTKNGETELDDFYILPSYRGRGIGSAVLEKCILEVKTPMFLYVFKENAGAISLYQRFGFTLHKNVGKTRMILHRRG